MAHGRWLILSGRRAAMILLALLLAVMLLIAAAAAFPYAYAETAEEELPNRAAWQSSGVPAVLPGSLP